MDKINSSSTCPRCGADNRCAIARGEATESCWCMQRAATLPLPIDADASCYCAACLAHNDLAERDYLAEHSDDR